jgi:hypothetical protein
VGAEAAARDEEAAAGWDAADPGMVWANMNPDSDNASAIANHPSVPARKRFKPCLKPECCPNADLIILPTEEIFVGAALAVQVIYPGAQPPVN